jgi:hypothetical protein
MAPILYPKKPLLVTKNIIPGALKLVDENKPDLKSAIKQFFQNLHSLMGKSLVDQVPANRVQAILDIVNQ